MVRSRSSEGGAGRRWSKKGKALNSNTAGAFKRIAGMAAPELPEVSCDENYTESERDGKREIHALNVERDTISLMAQSLDLE